MRSSDNGKSVWDPPRASDEEVRQLFDTPGFARVDAKRLSGLLVDQLVYAIRTRSLYSFAVTDVLQALEIPSRGRRVEERPFRRSPLRGLWHAHFFQAAFVPKNLSNEFQRREEPGIIDAVLENATELDEMTVKRLAHETTVGAFERRAARNALTGEWIVYAQDGDDRLYLSLARHEEGDQVIFDRMMSRCEGRFKDALISAAG